MDQEARTKTIGIIGAGRGCGTTHFAVLLANYLAAVEMKKTALVEGNPRGDIKKIVQTCMGKDEVCSPVSVFGVDYFFHGNREELEACIQGGYGVILLDLGSVGESRQTEFLPCWKLCVIASLNEWKLEEVLAQKAWMISGKELWKFFMAFGSEEARLEIRRRWGLKVERIPFAPDAFSIDREVAEFFYKVWKEEK